MEPDRDEIDALAAEYVLGTLEESERRAAVARMAADPEFRAAVSRWEQRLQPLAEAITPAAPHPDTFYRIVARIDALAAKPKAADNVTILRRSLARWRFATAVAAAAAVMLAVFVAVDRQGPSTTQYIATLTPEGGAPAFILTVDTASNTLTIRRTVAPPRDDRSFELWAVEPGATPQSMGVVEQASLTVPLPYEPDGLVFAISEEPRGGSPIAAPTGPVVFSGPLIAAH